MDEERLKNEMKKVTEAYTEIQSNLNLCNAEKSSVLNDNENLKGENRFIREKLEKSNKKILECENENETLLVAKRELCEAIQQLKKSTPEHGKLKAEVLTLEEQAIQLRLELDDAKALYERYTQENADLNECLGNAYNEAEQKQSYLQEKVVEINQLEELLEVAKQDIANYKHKIDGLTTELQKNSQDRKKVLAALQDNMLLTTNNDRLTNELIEILRVNNELQSQVYESERQILDLKGGLDNTKTTIANLESQKTVDLAKVHELTEQFTNIENRLKTTSEDRDNLDESNNFIENRRTMLEEDFENLKQLYKSTTEQLINALDKKIKLEEDIQKITGPAKTGDTIHDLQLSLKTCIDASKEVLYKLDNLPEELSNIELVDHEGDVYNN